MADFANKHCPRCGKRPLDLRLVQCPDCHVPFEYEATPAVVLTPAQMAAVTRHVLGSGKLWVTLAVALVLVTAGVVAFVKLTAKDLDTKLQQVAAHQGATSAQIYDAISNQVAMQFNSPNIQATIERVASEKAANTITNAVWSSLESFRTDLREAHAQLARARGEIAILSNDVKTVQLAAGQVLSIVSNDPPFLRLVDQAVTHTATNYTLTLLFRPSNGNNVGPVEIAAGTYRQTARILSFTARNVLRVEPTSINDVGDAADLRFTAGQVDTPILLELVLSDPTIVRLMSDSLEQELTLPVAVENMRLPRASR